MQKWRVSLEDFEVNAKHKLLNSWPLSTSDYLGRHWHHSRDKTFPLSKQWRSGVNVWELGKDAMAQVVKASDRYWEGFELRYGLANNLRSDPSPPLSTWPWLSPLTPVLFYSTDHWVATWIIHSLYLLLRYLVVSVSLNDFAILVSIWFMYGKQDCCYWWHSVGWKSDLELVYV